MARGEGRDPKRPATPKLRRFATDVRQAQGEAGIVAQNRVHRDNPKDWLRLAARWLPDDGEGSDSGGPRADSTALRREVTAMTDDQLTEALTRLYEAVVGRGVARARADRPRVPRKKAS